MKEKRQCPFCTQEMKQATAHKDDGWYWCLNEGCALYKERHPPFETYLWDSEMH